MTFEVAIYIWCRRRAMLSFCQLWLKMLQRVAENLQKEDLCNFVLEPIER